MVRKTSLVRSVYQTTSMGNAFPTGQGSGGYRPAAGGRVPGALGGGTSVPPSSNKGFFL